jgi:DNA-binding protein WhiA
MSFCDDVKREITENLKIIVTNNDNLHTIQLAESFLNCGTVVDPEKDYRLEFYPHIDKTETLKKLIKSAKFQPKEALRRGKTVLYFDTNEVIMNLLFTIFAPESAMFYNDIFIEKNYKNRVNRQINCELANIKKTASSAERQIAAIRKIQETLGLEILPKSLLEIAVLRLNNPNISLSELAEISGISRSSVNNRLRKIVNEAEKILDNYFENTV